MNSSKNRLRALSLALATLVVISVVAVGGTTAAVDDDYSQFEPDEPENVAADELLLKDDGSGVLVFADEDDVEEFALGASLAEGLAHVLVVDENEGDAIGSLEAAITDDVFTAAGDMTTHQPSALEELDFELVGEQTADDSGFDATLEAVVGQADAGGTQQLSTQQGALFQEATTDGEMAVGSDSFSATGNVDVDFGQEFTDDTPDEQFTLEIDDQPDGYELTITERQLLANTTPMGPNVDSPTEGPAEKWGTESAAEATLEEQYAGEADDLGGEVAIEIEHFDFEEREDGTYWSELDYTVTYEGIEDGLADELAAEFAADPATDLEEAEAEELATNVLAVTIETVEFESIEDDGTLAMSWTVELEDYADALEAFAEVDTLTDDEEFVDEFDEYEEYLAAQETAELRTTYEWELTATSTDVQQFEIEGEATSESENYQAYVDELADRGIDIDDDAVEYSFAVSTDDDELHVTGDLEMGFEDIGEAVATAMVEDLEEDEPGVGGVADVLADADLEVAQAEVDMDSQTVTFEAGASFSDAESVLEETTTESIVATEVVGQEEGDELVTYLSVEAPDGEELSTDELRDLELIDDETAIADPGDHDRDVPEMDTDRATAFLEGDDGDESDGIPGFGVTLALAGLLGVALAFARRT